MASMWLSLHRSHRRAWLRPGALDVLARKKNIRVLVAAEPLAGGSELISGGLLIQQSDQLGAHGDNPANWTLATGSPADPATLADLVFAVASLPCGQVERDSDGCDGATVGVRMVRSAVSTPPGWPSSAAASGFAAARWQPRMRSSPFPTAWKRWPPRESPRSSTPVARCATRVTGGGQGRCHLLSPGRGFAHWGRWPRQ